jgi:hypothetical protein
MISAKPSECIDGGADDLDEPDLFPSIRLCPLPCPKYLWRYHEEISPKQCFARALESQVVCLIVATYQMGYDKVRLRNFVIKLIGQFMHESALVHPCKRVGVKLGKASDRSTSFAFGSKAKLAR